MTIPASFHGKLAGLLVKNLTDERALGYVMNVPIFPGTAKLRRWIGDLLQGEAA